LDFDPQKLHPNFFKGNRGIDQINVDKCLGPFCIFCGAGIEKKKEDKNREQFVFHSPNL
jgi:hypothetical protein